MKYSINDIKTERFTQLEKFSDKYFDENYCDRFVKLFNRFMDDRSNLKVACLVAYLSAKFHNCKYIVVTAPVYTPNQGIDAGYELIKVEYDQFDICKQYQQMIRGVVEQYFTFKRINAFIVDDQGLVNEIVDVEQILS